MITQLWQLLKEIESEFGENTRLLISVDDGSWVVESRNPDNPKLEVVADGDTLAELLRYLPSKPIPQPKSEMAITWVNGRHIVIQATVDSVYGLEKFGSFDKSKVGKDTWDLIVDSRYDFDEVLAYIQSLCDGGG